MLVDIWLFLAAAFGGALNSVAGGGSFVALPALMSAGVPAVAANATTAMALWPGSMASAVAYRRDLTEDRWLLATLTAVSLVGGLAGAVLLLWTSDASFLRLLPWLMLVAAVTFTFGGSRSASGASPRSRWLVVGLQFAIAVYGGYFGGGMGIMMLATLSLSGMTDIHEMNGLKALLGSAINGIAVVEFVNQGAVVWRPGLVMVAGGVVGGYFGAALARRLDRRRIRVLVIVVAWAMTLYFFVH